MGVKTNPDISATCTVTADGGILPLYFIYPKGGSMTQLHQSSNYQTILMVHQQHCS